MSPLLRRLTAGAAPAALVAIGLAPLIPVFTLPVGIVPVLGGVTLGAAVAAWCAWRRWPLLLSLAALAGAYLALGPALAVPELAGAGLWPTWRAEQWLVGGLTAVWRRLLTVDTPVGPGGGFGLAPFALAYFGSATGLSLAVRLGRRRAPAAALAPLVVTAAAVLLGTRQSVLAVPLGLAAGLGALVWAAWLGRTAQPRRLLALALTLALAAGSGLACGHLAQRRDRLVVREQVTPPFDPRDYPSPLSAYRRYVKDGLKGEVVLKVANLPAASVVKLAVLDRFDGIVWNVASGGDGPASGNFGRRPAGPETADLTQVTLENHDSSTVWLYCVGAPAAVRFAGRQAADLAEALRFNPATSTMALPPAAPAGVTYTLLTKVGPARPAAEVIARAEAGAVGLPEGVRLLSADLAAAEVVRGAATGGAKALALEQHLQDGYYSDGQAGALEGAGRASPLAGHGADRIGELLTADLMVGNAEQYASAMALMARSVGLPARVVMGFAPGYGEQTAADAAGRGPQGGGAAAGRHTFTGLDMTAWVEVNLEGLGWVPFFPTPNRQDSPRLADEQPDPKPQPQVIQPPPPEARPSEPPQEEPVPVPVGSARPLPGPAQGWVWGPGAIILASAGALVAALAAAAGGVLLAKARRRRHRRLRGPPAYRVVAGWQEIADRLADAGLRSPPPTSPAPTSPAPT
ncbi:MAG: transglutaminase-like domain-containing protein, partial [Bifidobacteriaceae bacterium]|nr:transglutaminase-like domain-containing protein [Bifidobacteriaceae bacterium]